MARENDTSNKHNEQKIETTDEVTSYDEAVELTGHGHYNYLLLLTCSLITNACALDMFGFATVVAAASCDLQLDLAKLGIVASAPFFGVFFAFPWGYFADSRGRRLALIISTSVGFVFAVISAFSTHWIFMLVVKIIGSSFATASFTLTMTLLGECTGQAHRSQYLFIMQSFNLVSEFNAFDHNLDVFSFISALAWLILPQDINIPLPWLNTTFRPWRLYTIILALSLGIGTVLLWFLYESPKYLASKGDYEKALEALRGIYERNGGKRENYPVKRLCQSSTDAEKSSNESSVWETLRRQTLPIFKPPFVWRTVQLFFLISLCCVTNNVYVMWYPTIVNYYFSSFDANDNVTLSFCERVFNNTSTETQEFQCNDEISPNTLYAGMLYGIFYFVLSLCVLKIASRPRLLLIGTLVISGASHLLINLKEPVSNMVFFTLVQCTSMGIGSISSYFVDLYPTANRGLVTSLGMMVARLCSLVGVSVIGSVITHHCEATFYGWSVLVFGGIVVCLFLPADRKTIK